MKVLSYLLGIATIKRISAVLFIFQPGKSSDRTVLEACTGYVRHMGRFFESKTYVFVLDAQLTNGDAEVFLLDNKKRPLLKLSRQCPSQSIDLDGHCRYYLRWEFKSASGKCELSWQKVNG